jgi:hypothetical protein
MSESRQATGLRRPRSEKLAAQNLLLPWRQVSKPWLDAPTFDKILDGGPGAVPPHDGSLTGPTDSEHRVIDRIDEFHFPEAHGLQDGNSAVSAMSVSPGSVEKFDS